ncbi:helix-turn-helix domain-containing protein [Streptomyces montanisoli]|uniref:Helix-turn-helix transcriptional regulator n=1 Tax=Streptomyces montanisoli TaxID=2798581 RepID=A0A940MBJ3_9ACTN|nr:helix-turn-helix domain-containing protein [Streptomyces montanisoli]MBP0459914.1 helix-turn-helix transcriptional regulator [Streptomyces montanisoli]
MGRSEDPGQDPISELSSLDDPVRRRLYDVVAARDEPTAREDAAAAAGISRTLAAYHLDKLVDAGLLTAGYARPAGRGGPGAGRPAKRYARARRELSVSVPPRDYALLAEVLAEAVAADDSGGVREAVASAAHAAGRAAGRSAGGPDLTAALHACGYEPSETGEGCVELRNCPFHRLARRHTELVCGLNLHLVRGLLEASGERQDRAVLAPRADRCCVFIEAAGIDAAE